MMMSPKFKTTRLFKDGVIAAISLVVFASAYPSVGFAQKKTDASAEQRRAEQLRKLSAQNQQLESEKATLLKEKTDAQASAKLGEDKSKEMTGQNTRLSRELAASKTKNAELDKATLANAAETQKLNAQLVELKDLVKIQQTQLEQRAQMLTSMNEANTKLSVQTKELTALLTTQKDRGQTLTSELGSCSKNNVTLVSLVDEVSDRYRKKSCGDARSLLEPLMGLRAAEFERVSEEYRAKAGEERYVSPVTKP
jgi:chromosome segregation ATPase